VDLLGRKAIHAVYLFRTNPIKNYKQLKGANKGTLGHFNKLAIKNGVQGTFNNSL
jgi:hypothetical protein